MKTQVKDGLPQVQMDLSECPIFVTFRHRAERLFDNGSERVYSLNPDAVEVTGSNIGFQFSRRPVVSVHINGKEEPIELKGYNLWTSAEYYANGAVYTPSAFVALVEQVSDEHQRGRMQTFIEHQRVAEWAGVIVCWVSGEIGDPNGDWVLIQLERGKEMIVLDADKAPVTVIHTTEGTEPL